MVNLNVKILMIAALAIAVNVIFGDIVSIMKIPFLFLDCLGTVYVAARIDLKWGIMVGFCTNFLMSILSGFGAFPFVIVSIATAIVVYFMSIKGFGLIRAIITGIVLGVVCSLVSTVIRLAFFGGFTGSGTDIIILTLKASGQSLFTSTFYATLGANIIDKTVSCVLVSIVIAKVPNVLLKGIERKGYES